MRVVRPWLRVPREAGAAPSLAVFKARLDGALSNLVQWKLSPSWQGVWNQMIFKVPSNPYHSMILLYSLFRLCLIQRVLKQQLPLVYMMLSPKRFYFLANSW